MLCSDFVWLAFGGFGGGLETISDCCIPRRWASSSRSEDGSELLRVLFGKSGIYWKECLVGWDLGLRSCMKDSGHLSELYRALL